MNASDKPASSSTLVRTEPPIAADWEFDESGDFARLIGKQTNARDLLLNDETFDRIMLIARTMADGTLTTPKHLQGKVADCAAVVTQAFEWGMNPHTVAQKTHVVNGTLGYESQLVMAVVQRSGAIRGHFHFEFAKENGAILCRAGAVLRGDDEITWTEWYSSASVKVKNSPLWQTNVPQQMGYVQGRNWARLYAPGAILGVYTVDELEQRGDEGPPPQVRGPRRKTAAAPALPSLPAAAAAAANPETGEVPPPPPPAAPAAAAPVPPAAAGAATLKANEITYLRNKLKSQAVDEAAICDRFQVPGIEHLTREQFDSIKAELIANG